VTGVGDAGHGPATSGQRLGIYTIRSKAQIGERNGN
jgi:hypothetical protein